MNTTTKKPGGAATSTATAPAEAGADQAQQRKPLPEPEGGWPADEFTGLAGRFVRDPFTGKRRRADEPPPPADATTPAEGQ